ncbi:AlpA family phage regulatory protein [Actinoplanes sp. NEAU-H7]|uniref:AlpA family phage regulatory protein n=2 Tax=Actinoplanes flavus TaxID=2820290 RepID=A0ABS3UQE0_9ACTN|nr:AlpA family phage regulatory protein [Actinoplanes flavus]
MGVHEIRVRIGDISRQQAYLLVNRPDFPDPVAVLAQGKVWLVEEVEAWIAAQRSSEEGGLRPP